MKETFIMLSFFINYYSIFTQKILLNSSEKYLFIVMPFVMHYYLFDLRSNYYF